MILLPENSILYSMAEFSKAAAEPFRRNINYIRTLNKHRASPFVNQGYAHFIESMCEMAERMTRVYNKPQFNIKEVIIDKHSYQIKEELVLTKPFCHLLHFKKISAKKLPKLLIVAPLSGHHATLLRNTVEGLLPHFDVYITDWINARDVPLSQGSFDLDDFINYVIEFLEELSPDVHVMAVCQPTVPVLAAVSIMHAENNKHVPKSMILMGGPIDTRQNPTSVNSFALEKSIYWFRSNLVTRIPANYPGYMRAVYPGFMQLSSFMMMNLQRHVDSHIKLFNTLIKGETEKVKPQCEFYDEYFAVMDIPAEFYLQTVQLVFQDHALPNGKMVSRGRKVNPGLITKTALLGIEGELDDISGLGQTKAALSLCKALPASQKQYYLQKEVGHYGVFSGRRYRTQIVPVICDFVYKHL